MDNDNTKGQRKRRGRRRRERVTSPPNQEEKEEELSWLFVLHERAVVLRQMFRSRLRCHYTMHRVDVSTPSHWGPEPYVNATVRPEKLQATLGDAERVQSVEGFRETNARGKKAQSKLVRRRFFMVCCLTSGGDPRRGSVML